MYDIGSYLMGLLLSWRLIGEFFYLSYHYIVGALHLEENAYTYASSDKNANTSSDEHQIKLSSIKMLTEFIGKPRQPHDDERYATNDGLAKTQFLHAYEAGDGIGKTVSEGFILDAVNQAQKQEMTITDYYQLFD